MLLLPNFRLDYGELAKALGGEAPPAAPAAAAPTGAAPHGAEDRKRGGRYVKRWWDGKKWQYEYPGEGQPHGAMHFGGEDDPKRGHVLETHPSTPEGATPEQAYQHAFAAATNPDPTTGQHPVHQVPHPHPERGAAGEVLHVQSMPGGKVDVREASGKRIRRDPFDTHGTYEKWYREVRSGREYKDPMGRPWATVLPNVGKVDRVSGQLIPSGDPKRGWVVKFNRDNPDFAVKQGNYHADRRYPSFEAAETALNRDRRNIELTMPAGGGGAAPPAQPEQPAVASRVAVEGAPATPAAPAAAPAAPPTPQGAVPLPEGVQQHPVVAKLRWKLRPDLKRELALSPEEERRAIGEVAGDFAGPIVKYAQHFITKTPEFFGNDEYWFERLTGVKRSEIARMMSAGQKKFPLSPEPGSPLYAAIAGALSKYDPHRGFGLPAYLAAKDPRKAQLFWAMKEQVDALRNEAQRTTGETVGQGGDAQSRFEQMSTPAPLPATEGAPEPQEEEAPAGEVANDVPQWKQLQGKKLREAFTSGVLPQGVFEQAMNAVQATQGEHHVGQFFQAMNRLGLGDHLVDLGKSFASQILAITALVIEELRKANDSGYITRDKHVNPDHLYSHREGTEDHPRFYFRDANGNYVRYTNAPTGHGDAVGRFGDPGPHSSEPTFDTAPQFFTPDGKKLTRAPVQGAQVEWNPSYHPADPKNMWAGRWVNPATGQHEYSYVDADVRMNPRMQLHQEVALTDARIPVLRKYIQTLSKSPMIKDQIVGFALALLDQGRFRAQELTVLTPADITATGALIRMGSRFVFADQRTRSMVSLLTSGRMPSEPLLAVPYTKKKGDIDPMIIRRIGPHFLSCVLDQVGLSLPGLQIYHATQTFSREVNRLLTESAVPWESAIEYATLAVAREMGYDMSVEPDYQSALPLLRELLIDPIVIEVLEMNARNLKLVGDAPVMLPAPPPAVVYVSLDLTTRTSDEEDFSRWLHSYPAHEHAAVPMAMPQTSPTMDPRQSNPPNEPSMGASPAQGAV